MNNEIIMTNTEKMGAAAFIDQPQHIFFALDIGTRSVVGLLGTSENDNYKIIDFAQCPHRVRAMRDGQIEDIDLACEAVREVKKQLEARSGFQLQRVSIAAAGRALKTKTGIAAMDIEEDSSISPDTIRSIEYRAISNAQDIFSHDVEGSKEEHLFSCVGYSVVGYWLDNYPISNLEGHRGRNIRTEVIAAFLPFSVMRSLYAVTGRCDLEVENMTLEPIAAINAVVSTDLRLLNIAIADVGAGTTDIAISKDGSIVAYDMATIAGDELTESIMKHYLVDFDTAEEIKRAMYFNEEYSFYDILGTPYTAKPAEIIKVIKNTTAALCEAIAESILQLNDGPPVAAFLIGGGSQIPGICQQLAEKLGLPPNRVAHGGIRPYKYIQLCSEKLLSPEFVTPIGIGSISFQYRGSEFFSITVNDKKIMLLDSSNITVLDALLLAGIKATSLMGISPRAMTYYVNSARFIDRGTPAVPGELYVNGLEASMETPVKRGDSITAIPARNGIPSNITVADIRKNFEGYVDIIVNGENRGESYQLCNNDELTVTASTAPPPVVPSEEDENDRYDDYDSDEDDIFDDTDPEQNIGSNAGSVPQNPDSASSSSAPGKAVHVFLNETPVTLYQSGQEPPCFAELLNHSNIDTEKPDGILIMKLNGMDAGFSTPLFEDDHAEMKWSGSHSADTEEN